MVCVRCAELLEIREEAEVVHHGQSLCYHCFLTRKWFDRILNCKGYKPLIGDNDLIRILGTQDAEDKASEFAFNEMNGLPNPTIVY